MNELPEEQRPQSDDPDFWNVWTHQSERHVDWKQIADDWQGIASNSPSESVSDDLSDESDDIFGDDPLGGDKESD